MALLNSELWAILTCPLRNAIAIPTQGAGCDQVHISYRDHLAEVKAGWDILVEISGLGYLVENLLSAITWMRYLG